MIPHSIRNTKNIPDIIWYQEIVPDIAQSTHGIRNIIADIRNVPTRPYMVLGMFLLAFSVCDMRGDYCQRMQPLETRHTRTANRVSTAPSPNAVSDGRKVNVSMVCRGGGDIASHPQQVYHLHND